MSDQTAGRLARTESAARTVVLDMLCALILLGSIGAAVAAVVLPVNQLTQTGGATRVELSPEAQEQALAGIAGVPDGSWLEFVPDVYSISLHVLELSGPYRLLSEAGASLLLACLAGAGLLLFPTLRAIRLGAGRRNEQRWGELVQLADVVRAAVLQRSGGDGGNGDRHIGERACASGSGDDDHILRRSGFFGGLWRRILRMG